MRHIHSRPFPGGEHFLCTLCGATASVTHPVQAQHFAAVHAHPYGLGDLVQRATSAVGIPTCPPCEQRRRQMNNWAPSLWPRR